MNTLYDLQLTIESLDDGDYRYMATSPDLPNLIIVGDTIEEVPALAPQVGCIVDYNGLENLDNGISYA